MKKIVLLMTLVGLWSCSHDDEFDNYHPEYLPIESATFPTELKKDSVYEIPLQYIRPSTCHVYEGLYYSKNSNTRTIAVATTVLEQSNCVTAPVNPLTVILNFKPTTETSYIFKLWKGEDANGQDIFEETEIPVVP